MNAVSPLNPSTEGSEAEDGRAEEQTIWDRNTMAKVTAFGDTMGEIKTAREKLNARKAAAVTELVDLGFNKDALDAALKYVNTAEEKRENFDLTYIYARQALGQPIQDDLFTAATQQQVRVSKPAEE